MKDSNLPRRLLKLRDAFLRTAVSHCVCWVLILGSLAPKVRAQSGILNIPSSDIQAKGSLYVEADFFSHVTSYSNGGFQTYGPLVVYGARKNLEIGANLYSSRSVSGSAWELQPNFKWRFYESNRSGVAACVGAIGFLALNRTDEPEHSAMLYANVSKTFEVANGLRLTGGIYGMASTDRTFGSKKGLMIGIEQPVTKRSTILAESTTGRNRFGYSGLGFYYQATSRQLFGFGYSFGNVGRGNNYFTAFYGFTF